MKHKYQIRVNQYPLNLYEDKIIELLNKYFIN